MKRFGTSVLLLALFGGLTACGDASPTFGLLPEKDSFRQGASKTLNNQLDILWVIDNSGSMQPFQDELSNGVNSFINDFVTYGYDFHLATTTTEAYRPGKDQFFAGNSSNPQHILTSSTPDLINQFKLNAKPGTSGSGNEQGMASIEAALNSQHNQGFLRDESFMAIIILSDEEDNSPKTNDQHIDYLDTLTGTTGGYRRYNVSNISVLDLNNCTGHAVSEVGQRYQDLSAATDGITADICEDDYTNLLGEIQTKITTLSTQFYLSRFPVPETIVIKLSQTCNGVYETVPFDQTQTNGWYYRVESNAITFHGSWVPQQDACLEVDYTPQTIKN